MLLATLLVTFATAGALWLTYMVRYPDRWSARVDRHRQLLLAMGVNLPLMHRIEKGPVIRVLVALVVVITLACVAILLRHPTALQDFWAQLHHINQS